jgi:hypothetical protein
MDRHCCRLHRTAPEAGLRLGDIGCLLRPLSSSVPEVVQVRHLFEIVSDFIGDAGCTGIPEGLQALKF